MKKTYMNGLITGGFLGAVIGMIFDRKKNGLRVVAENKLMQEGAKKVFRGISRGVMEMLRK